MILKTLIDFHNVIPTAAGTEHFEDFEPYIRSAELWIRNNILGKALYDAIGNETINDPDLVMLCQNVIGNHAYWDAIPFLDVIHTESGFAVISAAGKVPASKERVERLREQCLIRRDNEVEFLITYLEEHPTLHGDWKASPAYSVMTECLIRTATELKEYGQWEGSRRDFLQLRPKMIQLQMTKLEPVFSKDYIEELIAKQRDGSLSIDDIKVIVLLKYAIGCLVVANKESAKRIASDAMRYIDNNLIGFATYTASSEYLARIAPGYVNTTDSTIFSSIM